MRLVGGSVLKREKRVVIRSVKLKTLRGRVYWQALSHDMAFIFPLAPSLQ